MRIEALYQDAAKIVLSERNLRSLLNKLERTDSERALYKVEEDGRMLLVVAEHNDEHYDGRGYPAGAVHPLDDPGI